MKFKKGVIITKNGDENIIVLSGEAGKSFSGMIKMNGTAAFIAGILKEDTDREKLVNALLEKYDVTVDMAKKSVDSVIEKFSSVGIIDF